MAGYKNLIDSKVTASQVNSISQEQMTVRFGNYDKGTIQTLQSGVADINGRVSLYYGMKLASNGTTSLELMNGNGLPYNGIARLKADKFLIDGDVIATGSIMASKLNIGPPSGNRLVLDYNSLKIIAANGVVVAELSGELS